MQHRLQAISSICPVLVWSHSLVVHPQHRLFIVLYLFIVFLQTFCARANGRQGTEQTGRVPLWGAHPEKYRSAPHSTWAHPWLLPCAQGNGQNLHFKALIKLRQVTLLAGDRCSVDWQFNPMEWSRENSPGLMNRNSSFFSGMGRGKKKNEKQKENKNPADQCLLPLFIQCPQPCTPRDFPDDLIFVLTHKC